MDLIIIPRTAQHMCRECKFKIHLQAIYIYANICLWPNEFSVHCRIAQLLSECQRASPALKSITTIFCAKETSTGTEKRMSVHNQLGWHINCFPSSINSTIDLSTNLSRITGVKQ